MVNCYTDIRMRSRQGQSMNRQKFMNAVVVAQPETRTKDVHIAGK